MRDLGYKQGDLFWFDFGEDDIPGVQAGMHPCVIVSNNLYNKYAPSVNIVAVSTKEKSSPVHVRVWTQSSCTYSFVYCEQWRTVNKGDLKEYIGRLSNEDLGRVAEAMIYQLLYRSRAAVGDRQVEQYKRGLFDKRGD